METTKKEYVYMALIESAEGKLICPVPVSVSAGELVELKNGELCRVSKVCFCSTDSEECELMFHALPSVPAVAVYKLMWEDR